MAKKKKRKHVYKAYSGNVTKDDTLNWWQNFSKNNPYPLYCTMLGYSANRELEKLVLEFGDELEMLSGNECCIILFRELERAKRLMPFQYSEHEKWVPDIVRAIGVSFDELPGLIFFEDLTDGDYIIYKVGNESADEIMIELREIFQTLSPHKDSYKKLSTLRRFQNSHRLIPGKRRVVSTLTDLGMKAVTTLLSEVIKGQIS